MSHFKFYSAYYEKDATVSEFLKIERMNKHIIDLGEL